MARKDDSFDDFLFFNFSIRFILCCIGGISKVIQILNIAAEKTRSQIACVSMHLFDVCFVTVLNMF